MARDCAAAASKLRRKMPSFVETYSSAQRAALFCAVLDDGMSVRGALDAAAAGELQGLDTAAQTSLAGMAYGYACQLVREEKEEREGVQIARAQPDRIARDIATRILKRAQRDAVELERRAGKRPMNLDESRQTDAALKRARDAHAFLRELDNAGKGNGRAPAAGKAPAPRAAPSLTARIAAQADTAAGNNAAPTDADGSAGAPRNSEPAGLTDELDGGAVRSRAAAAAPMRADAAFGYVG